MNDHDQILSEAESRAMQDASASGALTARIYRDGVFSEPDFVLLGVMQRLAIRGHLALVDLHGGQTNAAYTYRPVDSRVYAPALDRNAA